MDRIKREHNNYVVDLEIAYEDRFKELQLKNTSIQAEFRNGKSINATITQRIAMFEKNVKMLLQLQLPSPSLSFSSNILKTWPSRLIKNTMNY